MLFSRKELFEKGWKVVSDVCCHETFPASGHIVLTKDGRYIRHLYDVRTDDSDYPEFDKKVKWDFVEVYAKTSRYCRRISDFVE